MLTYDVPVGRSYGVEVSTLDSDQAQILPATPVRVRVRPLGYCHIFALSLFIYVNVGPFYDVR